MDEALLEFLVFRKECLQENVRNCLELYQVWLKTREDHHANLALVIHATESFEFDVQAHPTVFQFDQAPDFVERTLQNFLQNMTHMPPATDVPCPPENAIGVEPFLPRHIVF